MKRLVLAAVLLAAAVGAVLAQPPLYVWQFDGDQWNLMSGNVQVGALNGEGYRPRLGDGWGPVCEPPVAPPERFIVPCRCQVGGGCKCNAGCRCGKKGVNYGIDQEHWHPLDHERITINGREVSRGDADDALGDVLPEDAKKPWAVFIATDEADAKAARERLKEFEGKFRPFVCTQSDWYAKDRDGKPAFAPGLTLVTPDGRQARVKDFETLRKVPDGWDPDKTPFIDPKCPHPQPSPDPDPQPLANTPWCCYLAAAIIALTLLKKRS